MLWDWPFTLINETYYKKLENGQYEMTLTVNTEKYWADKKGKEVDLPLNDYLYIGVYGKTQDGNTSDKKLYYNLHKFSEKSNTVKVLLAEEPYKTGIDPSHLLIDRVRDDNIIELVRN